MNRLTIPFRHGDATRFWTASNQQVLTYTWYVGVSWRLRAYSLDPTTRQCFFCRDIHWKLATFPLFLSIWAAANLTRKEEYCTAIDEHRFSREVNRGSLCEFVLLPCWSLLPSSWCYCQRHRRTSGDVDYFRLGWYCDAIFLGRSAAFVWLCLGANIKEQHVGGKRFFRAWTKVYHLLVLSIWACSQSLLWTCNDM